MKAIIADTYGGPEVLQVEDVPVPRVGPNGVLVRVHASSVNPIDWKLRSGLLKAVRPFRFPVIWGTDLSGVVEETGKAVTLFKPGDEVYGFKDGAVGETYRGTYAEYAVVPEKSLARKPANLSHEEAATVPAGAATAWQALLNHGKLRPGSKVLVQGGAGGVGTFAVQIAKAFGAYVAATASGRNQEFLRELGADLPINYETEKLEEKISGYDMVLDGVGPGVWRSSLAALKRGGRLLTIALPLPHQDTGKIGFLFSVGGPVAAETVRALLSGKHLRVVMVKRRGGDLEKIATFIEAGKLRPVVQKVYPLEQVAEAHRVSEQGHVRGKLALSIKPSVDKA